MTKKYNLFRILVILTLASSLVIASQNNLSFAMEPSKLRIYAGPVNLPADNSTYECIFIQLQDAKNRPARALVDTTISLSSSEISVGNVDATITIPKGSTFSVAKFNSTFTPGTTTIAAAASGYAAVQTKIYTVAPVPARLAVYGLPPILPSDGKSYDALVVQLQDSSGSPAKAPLSGVNVTLSSSNSTIAEVVSSAIISGGETYTLASITSNSSGSAVITALTSGYTSAQTTIKTEQPLTVQPEKLRVFVAPQVTPADNTEHPQVVVQLLSDNGIITLAPSNTTIQLASSNENVGTVQPSVIISANHVQATATFSTTFKPGTTTITAAATDLTADTESLITIGPIPSKLTVFCTPSVLPADDDEYNVVQVQLQDSSGIPALDPDGDVNVILSSSDPLVGTVNGTLTIPYGQTYAATTFTTTYIASPTTITAQASGYSSGQAEVTTYIVDHTPLQVAVTANPYTVSSSGQTNITAYITYPGGNPTTDAIVKFTSNSSGTFTAITNLGNGFYTTTFTAPDFNTQASVIINATGSKTDYTTTIATTLIEVDSSENLGVIDLLIKDENGQPVSDAIVQTTTQPVGMAKLTNISNSSGHVSFSDVLEGSYTIKITKQGYSPKNLTFAYTLTMPMLTLEVTKENTQEGLNPMLIWLVLIAVIVIIIIVIAAFLQKRRTSAKFKVPKKWIPPEPPKFRYV